MLVDVGFTALGIANIQECDGWVYGSLELKLSRETVQAEETDYWVEGLSPQASPPEVGPQALLDFLNLRGQDKMQALDYLQEHGLFEWCDLRRGRRALPRKVKQYWKEAEEAGAAPFATSLDGFWATRAHLAYMWETWTLIAKHDHAAVKAASKRLGFPVFKRREFLDRVDTFWCGQMSGAIKGARLQAGMRGGRLFVVATTVALRPALHMSLLAIVSREMKLAACENHDCRRLFVKNKLGRRFCSKRCQTLLRVRRYREQMKIK